MKMAKRVVERWMPSNLDELTDALHEIRTTAYSEGVGDHSTVYVDVRDLSLIEETLTDGSQVWKLVVRENR